MAVSATSRSMVRPLAALIAILVFLGLPLAAAADTGPKPSADIKVTYQGGPLPADRCYARMLACSPSDAQPQDRCTFADPEACRRLSAVKITDPEQSCTWRPAPMAWGGDCQDGLCHFSYFLPDRFRLAVYLPGPSQIYVTNPIARPNFDSSFQVDLQPDGTARIQETTSPLSRGQLASFLIALPLTLLLELSVAWLFVRRLVTRRRILLTVLVANLLSLPLVWFVFARLGSLAAVIVVGELFAVVFEAAVIHLANRSALSPGRSLVLSVAANAASFLIGGPVLLLLSLLGLTR